MEMEYFIHEDADWAKCHEEWIEWCEALAELASACPTVHLSRYTHPKEKLAFYSRGTVDIMFKYPFGVQELWGIAARGNYDLTQHANASGKPQEIFDEATKKKFVPHVIEPAVGVDRIFLAVLCAGYAEEDVKDEKGNVEKRTVLRLSARASRRSRSPCSRCSKTRSSSSRRAQALYTKAEAQLRRVLRRSRRDRPTLPPPGRDRHAVVRDDRFRHDRKTGRHLHPARARFDGSRSASPKPSSSRCSKSRFTNQSHRVCRRPRVHARSHLGTASASEPRDHLVGFSVFKAEQALVGNSHVRMSRTTSTRDSRRPFSTSG